MALNPNVIKAIKERDTSEIIRFFAIMRDLYRINYIVTDQKGIVLARTHEPENFGDSVLNQQNIKDALTGKVSTYFESGTAVRVSVRTGSPVYDTDGTLIGAVSAGVRFDSNREVEELKKLFDSEVTVFLGNTRIATTITRDGQSIVGTTLDPRIAEIVIEKRQEYSGDAEIIGEKYKTFYMPLLNAQNEAFATFFLGIPKTEIIAASNKSIRGGILLGLGGLAVSIALLFFIISSISEPIIKLSGDMDRIANGNLNINIDVKGDDEIGHLARSFQKVAGIIRKLLQDINIMIGEHEKGNTEYTLNTEEFQGDYKTLALSVIKFAVVGLTDQVTGIPNRRNFDSRMNWEWKRAMKEASPVSILIIDIDKFKKYNDSFGHQQSELALKTVARTVKQLIKPATDFIARWGSDEFAVLLPAADSDGAFNIAEKIRTEVEKTLVPCTHLEGLNITVSIGVNTLIPTPGKTIDSFFAIADAALLKAKETGRNKVVFGGEG
jgi:diguanylate cyclase (GGDEF)-like protein